MKIRIEHSGTLEHEITKSNIMQNINKCMGDIRTLKQSESCPNYFFKDVEMRMFINEDKGRGYARTKEDENRYLIDGTLNIYINISKEKAKKFREIIENAGSGAFSIGSSGLAYIRDINITETSGLDLRAYWKEF